LAQSAEEGDELPRNEPRPKTFYF